MANSLNHVYATVHGTYTTAPWTDETAQIGVRVAFARDTLVFPGPEVGSEFVPEPGGEIVGDAGVESGTHGTLSRTWKARIGPEGCPQNANAAWQVDLAEDLWTYVNSVKNLQHSQWRWTHVRIAAVDSTGHSPRPAATYTFTSPIAPTGNSPLPPQLAIAASTRAAVVGRRGRGRHYLPAINATALSGMVVSSAAQSQLVTNMQTLIAAIHAQPGVDGDYLPFLVIMSATSHTAIRPSQVRVGDHVDVQRRRSGQVRESYAVGAL